MRGLEPTSYSQEVSPRMKKARYHENFCTRNASTRAELAESIKDSYTKSQIDESFMFGLPDCFDGKSQEKYFWVSLWINLTIEK